MEIGKQIKYYRQGIQLSQEDLAEKIFVTRQSISNWETGKNYPDIHSLLLLSSLFDISLDKLVKGDLKMMKEQVNTQEIKRMNRDSVICCILIIATIVSIAPLFMYMKGKGVIIWIVLAAIMMYFAMRIEKQKKIHDIQTYKEIVAFMNGQKLDEMEKVRESGKRIYQKIFYIIGSGIIGGAVAYGMCVLLDWL